MKESLNVLAQPRTCMYKSHQLSAGWSQMPQLWGGSVTKQIYKTAKDLSLVSYNTKGLSKQRQGRYGKYLPHTVGIEAPTVDMMTYRNGQMAMKDKMR